MKFVTLILAILLLILLMVKIPPPSVEPMVTSDQGPESVADVAMSVGACGMRAPQLA
jgi:hypothetical protein